MLPVILGALLALLLLFLLLGRSGGEEAGASLPDELSGASLWQSEASLVRTSPVHVRGRPDEVWLKNGRRYIVESKSRAGGVFPADRMQLAAYAYLLASDDGPPVARHGYLRFTGGETTFARVRIWEEDRVVEAHRRYRSLCERKAEPTTTKSAALCRGCGHADRCPASLKA